jgi:hypothetical protein
LRSTVDEEEGGALSVVNLGGGGRGGGGYGGIQEETDSSWISVMSSLGIPIELRLQLDQAALMGLKLFKKRH